MDKRKHLIIILLFMSIMGFAQETTDIRIPNKNGHRFIPSSLTFGAFNNTSFSSNFGLGSTSEYQLPVLSLGDTTLSVSGGDILFANLGIRYRQRIKDWVSASVRIAFTGRIGSEPRSLLTQGINTISGFELGWNMLLMNRKKYNLSIDFGVKNYTGSFVDVLGFVQDVVNNRPNPSISETVPAVQGVLGLNYTWGVSQLLGLILNGTLTYGDSFVRGDSAFDYIFSAGFDVNLYPKTKVPIGVLFGYTNTSHPETSFIQNQNADMFNMKLAYTGSNDFNIALDFWRMNVPLNLENERVDVNQVNFNLTYFFN